MSKVYAPSPPHYNRNFLNMLLVYAGDSLFFRFFAYEY